MATTDDLVPQPLGAGKVHPVVGRKPWQTPRFIVSEVHTTENGSSPPPPPDSPYSQAS